MALVSPVSLRSVGLQLSFAATFAVLHCLPRRTPRDPKSDAWRHLRAAVMSIRTAFVLSLAVEVFIAPLQLHHFHVLSAVGPMATVVFFIPVTLVLLGAVPVAGLVALLPAQEWGGAAMGGLCAVTNHLIVACGRLAPAPLAIPEPNPWLYYGALLLGGDSGGTRRAGPWRRGSSRSHSSPDVFVGCEERAGV
jgi:predicted membrane metal-binding protein